MLQSTPTSPTAAGRIHVLADALVDQIAAGEVVERPASVVKELVENSLDAGARTIRVDVRDGGAALVAVQDDGFGMSPEELPLALARHATSKLRTAEDLSQIRSFGFRGEALPAIASVSRFRIVSRARGADAGHEIRIDGGRLLYARAAGGPEGTRIEVADLFASVPARRKFLKRPGTEWGHIADWLARLAMARPEIHLEIHRDERPATIWPACSDRRDRLALLLPDEEAAGLVAVDHTTEAAHVHGFVSSPELSRATGQGLHLFVNGRPVRDRLLSFSRCASPTATCCRAGAFRSAWSSSTCRRGRWT
jgi:DNA mismatch repair protein MutL